MREYILTSLWQVFMVWGGERMVFLIEPNVCALVDFSFSGPCDQYTAPCDCDAVREVCGGDWGTT